jgi:hypothetical protein
MMMSHRSTRRRVRRTLFAAASAALVVCVPAALAGFVAGSGSPVAVGTAPRSVAVGDLNGDGNTDLAVANSNGDGVSVLLGNGDGTFAPKTDYGTGIGTKPYWVAVGDLDGDDDADLVTADSGTNQVSVLLGNGDGSFAAHVDYPVGDTPQSVAVGDLDGNGSSDLAVANSAFGEDSVSVLLGNGDGTFRLKTDYATGGRPQSVAVGDVNGDHKLDLATADLGNTLSVLIGNGDGTFGASDSYPTGPGSGPAMVAVADLDGDDYPELVGVDNDSSTVSVLPGSSSGTFGTRADYPTGTLPVQVAVADLDGDGNPDLAVTNGGSNSVSVLLGNGDRTFAAKIDHAVDNVPYAIAATDQDGDGRLDLVVSNFGADAVSVLLQDGKPGAPTGVGATAGSDRLVTVSWTAPVHDGHATITGYTVTASGGGGQTCTWTSGPLSCTVSGLTSGTAYTFTVTATNSVGTGPASSASASVTVASGGNGGSGEGNERDAPTAPTAEAAVPAAKADTEPPSAPAGLTGRFVSGALTLSWQAATDNLAVDHLEIYLDGTPIARVPAGTTSASVRIFNPTGRSIITVRAVDAAGNRSADLATVTVTRNARPKSAPRRIPRWAWELLAWQQHGAKGRRPAAPKRLPAWYPAWKTWRLAPFGLAPGSG